MTTTRTARTPRRTGNGPRRGRTGVTGTGAGSGTPDTRAGTIELAIPKLRENRQLHQSDARAAPAGRAGVGEARQRMRLRSPPAVSQQSARESPVVLDGWRRVVCGGLTVGTIARFFADVRPVRERGSLGGWFRLQATRHYAGATPYALGPRFPSTTEKRTSCPG